VHGSSGARCPSGRDAVEQILCEFQVLEAWDTGHKKSPGELALFSSNMAILLVLNVGNGWVAGVAGIINSYCGSFPKIPYV